MPSRVTVLVVVSLLACPFSGRDALAQHFGKNKVEYVDFDFKVLQTEHFSVYHYPSEETAARIAARLAERWYARLSRVLEHQLDGRQPLILYGSQPEFAQTNVVNGLLGEGIGGVTESARRRIVMPFAPTLAETDRILGHELTHAFQFDMARRYRGGLGWPLWVIEGLAQYLSLGGSDAETAMWLRDAVAHNLLPERQHNAARRFSPYRYGHAFWAYLAGRFGDRVVPEILKARDAGTLQRRIKAVTGVELETLFADWRDAACAQYASRDWTALPRRSVTRDREGSGPKTRLYLGPAISPDGRRVVFFSERDRVSIDLFLADARSGRIVRKLATTAASLQFESLQPIRSAGSWSPEGDWFVFAAIERGKPALVILDIENAGRPRVIRLPQFGQVLSPSWSPDGRTIAFSAVHGGLTDLYLYDLEAASLRQVTDDPHADLHPEWSPDGRRLAFVTDRFSTDLSSLAFGPTELALVDVRSGSVERLVALDGAPHYTPQWSDRGESLYFVSSPDGRSNVFRLEIASGAVTQITHEQGGVAGLTPSSPALSSARAVPTLAFTAYRSGRYTLEVRRGADALTGLPRVQSSAQETTALPPSSRPVGVVEQVLDDIATGLPTLESLHARAYESDLFLEALGPPYVSSGRGPFGTFVRGGGSFLFSDLLGEQKIAVLAQAGNHLRDLGLRVQYLNRERQWNWGASLEVGSSIRRLPHISVNGAEADAVFRSETHYFERTDATVSGLLAYPLDRARRFEFEAGARHSVYRRSLRGVTRSLPDGRVLSRTTSDVSAGSPTTVMEASAAYVRDTAVVGPVSPIVGGRSRLEVGSTFGELSTLRLLVDHRRYLMPVKPYTVAFRAVHLGQYGRDANDLRLLPTFLGSRYFLRGYGWDSIRCQPNAEGECTGYDELLGSRLLVANVEVRAPLLGIRTRDIHYGSVPAEAFVFFDGGLVWSRSEEFSTARSARRLARSFGLGARMNVFGLPLEWATVRAVDPPSHGWSFGLSFRPAF